MTFRKTGILFLFLGVVMGVKAQITIGGLPVVPDTTAALLLCSLPEASFTDDYHAAVKYDTTQWQSVSIDGEPVEDNALYEFGMIGDGASFALVAHTANGDKSYTLQFTFLPIVQLQGDFGYDYAMGSVSVTMPGQSSTLKFTAKAKWRGGTTNSPDRHKRNYHVKLLDGKGESLDYSFFGLRNDNDWLLDAGQVDLARIRNHVGMELWNEMAAKPYYASKEPLALNGVRSHMVEVFLNGTYNGIYSMGEAIDRKQMKLKKYDEDKNVVQGQLWKTISWTEEVLMRRASTIENASPVVWQGYETKYPDVDQLTSADYAPLHDALSLVAYASDEEFSARIADTYDLPVLADYFIFVNLLNAVDNVGKNIYWAIYDRTQSPKLTLSPWDLDATVGQYWNNFPDDGQITPSRKPENNLNVAMLIYSRLLALNTDGFADKLKQHYIDLRRGVLSADSLVGRYVGCIEMLEHAGAAQREEQRWSGDTDVAGLTLDFEGQKSYIEQWLRKRLAHVDTNVFHLPKSDINGDGMVDVTDLSILIDMVLGKTALNLNVADIDGNGKVDVADVSAMIDRILTINPNNN